MRAHTTLLSSTSQLRKGCAKPVRNIQLWIQRNQYASNQGKTSALGAPSASAVRGVLDRRSGDTVRAEQGQSARVDELLKQKLKDCHTAKNLS
jgi:hypothetical protein